MASGKIKGITIEIGGDTTKLGKAIEGSEKQTRSLQVELRQIEKLLQFDPTNTELLAQKQKVLADAVAETSNKLDIMKEAEAQVIAQFERGDIGEDQLRAFQREIVQTENSLNQMETELRNATRNLDEFGDNNGVAKEETARLEQAIQEQNSALEAEKNALKQAEQAQKDHEQAVEKAKETLSDFKEKAGDAFDKVKTGALALGTATVATAGYALKLSTDFDKAFNTLVTRTGASKDEFEALNTAMENVYKNNFGESIEDVAQSMATVQVNTKLSGEELQRTTEHALLLRDTFEFEVNESTRSAKMLMDQYGLSAEQAYNLIVQGAQNGLDKNGDLLDTINEYGVHFANLGLSAEDMFNMLINGAENGTFSVDKLGDAVKEFGIRVKDGTADNAFKELGFDIDETKLKFNEGGASAKEALLSVTEALFAMEDPVKQNQLGVELFGTMWEDLGLEGVKALMNINGEASTTKNALADLNNQKYDDIGSALTGLGRTLETDVMLPLGDKLKPVVEEVIGYVQNNAPQIVETLSGVVDKVSEFVSTIMDNKDGIISALAGIGAGFAVWSVASTINAVVSAVKAYQLANEGATVAQALFNAALNANPLMLIITIITAVVVAIGTFIATNDEARAKVVEVWNNIKTKVSEAVETLKTKITTVWENVKTAVITAVENIKTKLTTIWNNIKTTVSTVVENIKTKVITIWENIKTTLSTVVENIKTKLTTVWNNIKTTVTTIVNNIKTTLTTVWNNIKTTITTVINNIKTTIDTVWNAIKTTITTVVNSIKSTVTTVWNSIKTTITTVVNGIKSTITTVWNSIKSTITTVVNGIKSTITTVWNSIKSTVTTVTNSVKSTITTVWNAIKNTTTTVWNSIKSAITKPIESAKSIFTKAIQTMRNALNFSWKLPDLKLPHISVSGGEAPFGIGGKGSLPRFSIQWYKDGAIFKRPTIFPTASGFKGVGEAGAEAVAPLQDLLGYIQTAVDSSNNGMDERLARIEGMIESYLPAIATKRNQIILDSGVLVGETINQIDERLANTYMLKARGI